VTFNDVATRRQQQRPSTCIECAAPLTWKGTGRPPKFCGNPCRQRHHGRKKRRSLPPLAIRPERTCEHCGVVFIAKNRNRRYCYGSCAQKAYQQRKRQNLPLIAVERIATCDGCNVEFSTKMSTTRWCSKRCANRYWGAVRYRQRGGKSTADYTDLEVFQRDGWCCHLCNELVDWTVHRLHPDGATIDHIVPIARGGRDELSNVATAHWRCNHAKGALALGRLGQQPA
jgi:5-methylcytosine-specific restriction endonuclease McrA